jgi:hypothetical protein
LYIRSLTDGYRGIHSGGARSHDRFAGCPNGRRASLDPELHQNVGHVRVHGADANAQDDGNFSVPLSLRDPPQDFDFPIRQSPGSQIRRGGAGGRRTVPRHQRRQVWRVHDDWERTRPCFCVIRCFGWVLTVLLVEAIGSVGIKCTGRGRSPSRCSRKIDFGGRFQKTLVASNRKDILHASSHRSQGPGPQPRLVASL